jgi:hypothetical protein
MTKVLLGFMVRCQQRLLLDSQAHRCPVETILSKAVKCMRENIVSSAKIIIFIFCHSIYKAVLLELRHRPAETFLPIHNAILDTV